MADQEAARTSDEGDLIGLYDVTDDLVREVRASLADGDVAETQRLFDDLHAADRADLIENLPQADRERLDEAVGGSLDGEVLSHLDYNVRDKLIESFDPAQIANVVNDLDSDDAIDIIEYLDEDDRQAVLENVPPSERVLYEQALAYPEESAGRLMKRHFAAVPSNWNVGQVIDYARAEPDLPNEFFGIFVVGPDFKPIGVAMANRILRSKRETLMADIVESDIKLIPAEMDQEDVAFLFSQYDLTEAPVVDEAGRIVGVITVDDIVDVIQEEHEEDMLKMGGVKTDDLYDAVISTTKSRLSWLVINLATAILASVFIGLFQAEIERVVALAVLMPIVASMGGNAGTQTLTVAVRALAVKELTPSNAFRIVGKEVVVGGINGFIFAGLMGGITYAWFGDLVIAIVIGLAMIINLFVAGLAGILVPLALDRANVDPAVASSVILTTITDVVGFCCFLGLAAAVLF